jgi:hypothetical protein
VLWHARHTVRGDPPGARHTDASIPAIFAIPADAPPTSSSGEERIIWTLRAAAALPETDFSCVFEIPIQRSDDPDLLMAPVYLLHSAGTQEPDLVESSSIQPLSGPGLRFKATWNRATELVTVAYFLFWFQLVWLATSHPIGWETRVIFGAGLWFLAWTLGPWASSTEIGISQGLFQITNRSAFAKRTALVPPGEVADIRVRPSSLRTGLLDGLDFYHLELQSAQGNRIIAGRHLRDRLQAEAIARAIRRLIAQA